MLYKEENIYYTWVYLLGDWGMAREFPLIKITLESPCSSIMMVTHAISICESISHVMEGRDVNSDMLTFTHYHVKKMNEGEAKDCRKKLSLKYEIMHEPKPHKETLQTREEMNQMRNIVVLAVEKELKVGDKWYFVDHDWFKRLMNYLELEAEWDACNDGRVQLIELSSSDETVEANYGPPGPIAPQKIFFKPHLFKTEGIGRYYLVDSGLTHYWDYVWIAEEGWNVLIDAFGFGDDKNLMSKMARSGVQFNRHFDQPNIWQRIIF